MLRSKNLCRNRKQITFKQYLLLVLLQILYSSFDNILEAFHCSFHKRILAVVRVEDTGFVFVQQI